MRTPLMAFVTSASLALTACQQPSQTPAAPRYDLSIQVAAEECTPNCRFIIATVKVRNTGRELLCIPDVYDDRPPGALLIRYQNGRWAELAVPSDGNLFLSPRPSDALRYIEAPQHILHPGETWNFRIHFDGQYDLLNQPAEAVLRFIAFDCRSPKHAPIAKRAEASAAVTFS